MKPAPKRPAEEYFETPNCGLRRPELNLLAAIMARAIHDCFSGDRNIQAEALEWVFNEESRRPFGFFWTCQHLGFDHRSIRKGIQIHRDDNQPIDCANTCNVIGDSWDWRLRA